jgi:hypothetical protein
MPKRSRELRAATETHKKCKTAHLDNDPMILFRMTLPNNAYKFIYYLL